MSTVKVSLADQRREAHHASLCLQSFSLRRPQARRARYLLPRWRLLSVWLPEMGTRPYRAAP